MNITTDFTMTLEQLSEMDGRTDATPIYLSLGGHIYDVSSARKMYGPGGSYHSLVGKDATLMLAYGCSEDKCLANLPRTLNEGAKKELDRWIELYHNHDKYSYIGELVTDFIDIIVSEQLNSTRN
jgi:predicted heme/steroid binding protein